ncbi:hypothetical protein MMC10_010202, partial [Thelotrema lepadinum]|nr:hypothetical protein [Thelotrema lepadinum]
MFTYPYLVSFALTSLAHAAIYRREFDANTGHSYRDLVTNYRRVIHPRAAYAEAYPYADADPYTYANADATEELFQARDAYAEADAYASPSAEDDSLFYQYLYMRAPPANSKAQGSAKAVASGASNRKLPPSQCVSKGATLHTEWAVYMNGNTMGNWGQGLLDNVNGRGVCSPTSWQAQLDNKGGVAATFNSATTCSVNDVSDAIKAASGQWVHCSGDTLSNFFDSAATVIQGLEQVAQT